MRCSTCTSRPVDCPCRSAGCKCFLTRRTPDEIVYLRADKPASDGVRRANDDDL
jgi:hypothetical protein